MAHVSTFFEYLRAFARAVPREYRQRYDAFALSDIARIAYERGDRPLNAGRYRCGASGAVPVCVVARDHQSLVSSMSRAIVLTRAEVTGAEAFTLDSDTGVDGVVGLFAVRSDSKGDRLRREQANLIIELLVALGDRSTDVRRAAMGPRRAPSGDTMDTTVRFLEGMDGTLSVLEVETRKRSGLLSTLVDVFMAERLQIVHCEVQAWGDRVRDRFRLVEHDGGSIAPSRWLQIQSHVLDAIARTTVVAVRATA